MFRAAADLLDKRAGAVQSGPAGDARAVSDLQSRLGKQIDGLSLSLAPQPKQKTFRPAERQQAAAVDLAEQLFGKRVVFFTSDRPLANGVYSLVDPGRVFINAKSTRPELAVLGHELTHAMRQDRPDLFDGLREGLRGLIRNADQYDDMINARRAARGLRPLQLDTLREELVADIVGDNFTDPVFWKAMAEQQPGAFRQLGDQVLQWLDDVIARITEKRPFGTSQYLTDLKSARRMVADTMRDYAAGETGGARMRAEDGGDRFSLDVKRAGRELRMDPADGFFDWVGSDKAGIWADTAALLRKHPEHFKTEAEVQQALTEVLEAPEFALPATKPEYTLLVAHRYPDAGDRAAGVVELELKGGKYRVRSVYRMPEAQLQKKLADAEKKGVGVRSRSERSFRSPGEQEGEPSSSSGSPAAPSDAGPAQDAEPIVAKPRGGLPA